MVRPAAAVAVLLLALAAGAAAASNDGAGRRGVRGGYTAPWTLCRMRPALTAAKLQVRPKYEKSIRNLVGWSSPEFYVKDDAVEFVMEGTSHRSELRFNAEWSTASAEPQRLVGLVHLPAPGPSVEQYTWMQIHGGTVAGVPLLRLYWLRDGNRGGRAHTDALLAAVRLNNKKGKGNTRMIYLGQRPDGPFFADMRVQNNTLQVLINGETRLEEPVAYWSKYQNYFKAGVYVQAAKEPVTVRVLGLREYP